MLNASEAEIIKQALRLIDAHRKTAGGEGDITASNLRSMLDARVTLNSCINIAQHLHDAAAELNAIPNGYIPAYLSTAIHDAKLRVTEAAELLDNATNKAATNT